MIVWSDEAKKTYEAVIDDLLKKWPINVALDFEEKTNNLLDILLDNKQLCQPTKHKRLRKCVIHKNVSLIYKINRRKIEIVTFIFNKDDHRFYE
ncbi:MAG: type II toxin-antitoxin system RelE/ParE family toxin [Brumimicrobium sp.]